MLARRPSSRRQEDVENAKSEALPQHACRPWRRSGNKMSKFPNELRIGVGLYSTVGLFESDESCRGSSDSFQSVATKNEQSEKERFNLTHGISIDVGGT